jgi:branched-chain amino acid transport system substrate-binding protein
MLLAACSSSKNSSSNTTTATSAPSSSATTAGGGSATTTGGGGSLTASDTGVSPTTIKIGYISSLTGVASSNFQDGLGGAQAVIDAANAAGGVDGRKLQLVSLDDGSTPAGFASAAQAMIAKGVFAVIPYSSFLFGGYKYFQQAGMPVTGFDFDGPEWGIEPNSNMFSFLPPTSTAWNGEYHQPNLTGTFLQTIGVKKPAGFAYGISPSSRASIKIIFAGGSETGISQCYANYSVPFGGVDFTADVLQVKQLGCDAVVGSFVDSSDQAMAAAVTQAGLTNVAKVFFTGYDNTTLATAAARTAYEGSYFPNTLLFDTSLPPIKQMYDTLAQYDPGYKAGSIPDFGLWGSYIATQEMIYGLQQAGQNPTRKSFINNMRQISSWDDGGLLPSPTSFTNFGTPAMIPNTNCEYVVQLKNGAFVNANSTGKPYCTTGLVVFPAT